MVSPQIILVGLALIAFFATGGIDKATRAISTAKSDFTRVKGQLTNFRSELQETTAKEDLRVSTLNPTIDINDPDLHIDQISSLSLNPVNNFPIKNPDALPQKLMRGI